MPLAGLVAYCMLVKEDAYLGLRPCLGLDTSKRKTYERKKTHVHGTLKISLLAVKSIFKRLLLKQCFTSMNTLNVNVPKTLAHSPGLIYGPLC